MAFLHIRFALFRPIKTPLEGESTAACKRYCNLLASNHLPRPSWRLLWAEREALASAGCEGASPVDGKFHRVSLFVGGRTLVRARGHGPVGFPKSASICQRAMMLVVRGSSLDNYPWMFPYCHTDSNDVGPQRRPSRLAMLH